MIANSKTCNLKVTVACSNGSILKHFSRMHILKSIKLYIQYVTSTFHIETITINIELLSQKANIKPANMIVSMEESW